MKQLANELDVSRLAPYLEDQIEGFTLPMTWEKFSVGQSNPTFLLSSGPEKYVLRRKPSGQLLKSAHMIEREFRVFEALQDSPVPVPRPYCLCEDSEVLGSTFYVMSYEEGLLFQDATMPDLEPQTRAKAYDELIRALASIHDVDIAAVGLSDYGKAGNYFERQLQRWTKQYRASETQTIESMETLMRWLGDHVPKDDGQVSLIHGDYKLDNIMFETSDYKVRAILDWELSTLGHPIADLAFLCMTLRLPPGGYVQGLEGVDRQSLGIPTENELVSRYCELRKIDNIEHWTFYLAFSFFRLASIAQGVLKRALMGNASSEEAVKAGSTASPLSQMALNIIEEGD